MTDKLEIYFTRSLFPGQSGWAWRYRHANGNVLATCGRQRYSRRIDMLAAAGTVLGILAEVVPGETYRRSSARPVRVVDVSK